MSDYDADLTALRKLYFALSAYGPASEERRSVRRAIEKDPDLIALIEAVRRVRGER